MNWLCSISLASTQLAYAAWRRDDATPERLAGSLAPESKHHSKPFPCEALGVLGCLYTTDVER